MKNSSIPDKRKNLSNYHLIQVNSSLVDRQHLVTYSYYSILRRPCYNTPFHRSSFRIHYTGKRDKRVKVNRFRQEKKRNQIFLISYDGDAEGLVSNRTHTGEMKPKHITQYTPLTNRFCVELRRKGQNQVQGKLK